MSAAIVYLIPLVLAAYYLCAWWLVHAKSRQAMVVRYQPPTALSPSVKTGETSSV